MTNLVLGTGLLGVVAGLALSAYGHTSNGFVTGPGIVLGLAASTAGTIGAASLLVVGKRSASIWGLASFSVAMLCALILLPLVWPYPSPSKPIPLQGFNLQSPRNPGMRDFRTLTRQGDPRRPKFPVSRFICPKAFAPRRNVGKRCATREDLWSARRKLNVRRTKLQHGDWSANWITSEWRKCAIYTVLL
jgi:hypothetical protein